MYIWAALKILQHCLHEQWWIKGSLIYQQCINTLSKTVCELNWVLQGFSLPLSLVLMEGRAVNSIRQPSPVISRLATMDSRGAEGEKMDSSMCLWQIPVQHNEAHRHSGSCDSFLRPDGTLCYPSQPHRGPRSTPTAGTEILIHWWPSAPAGCNLRAFSL